MIDSISDTGATLLTTNRKALTLNLEPMVYGTFAEIGAAQEVVRHFFKAGGASNTVAKSMSAYDMTFSDSIYGKAKRYVSRERMGAMLEHEYSLLVERLGAERGPRSTFFAFANTVATAGEKRGAIAHAWMGIRFQTTPGGAPNDIHVHVRLWDKSVSAQQDALGIVGVNLVYAAFSLLNDPDAFAKSLVDAVGADRVEVDFLNFTGPAFTTVDNRVIALKLVEQRLTNAVVFGPDGAPRVPGEFFWKKSVLVERGYFRPVAMVNTDMMERAAEQLLADGVPADGLLRLFEITLNPCVPGVHHDYADLLSRADLLAALGHPVVFTDYREFYRLPAYFRRYTTERVAVVAGVNNLVDIFADKYYTHLDGGVLEACGRLFKDNVRLYVYPMRLGRLRAIAGAGQDGAGLFDSGCGGEDTSVVTADCLPMRPAVRHLFAHLLETDRIVPLLRYDEAALACAPRTLADRIANDEPGWEHEVPETVAEWIRARRPWGGHGACAP